MCLVSTKKKRASRNMICRMLSIRQEKLRLPTGVHILRHAFLSAVDRTPGGAELARDLSGHSSVSITNIYLHASDYECERRYKPSWLCGDAAFKNQSSLIRTSLLVERVAGTCVYKATVFRILFDSPARF